MNKSNLMKKIFILILTLMCIVFACDFVYAADEEDDFQDLFANNTSDDEDDILNTSNPSNTNKSNTSNTSNTSNKSNTLNTNSITNTNNNTSSLPKTGLNDMMPVTLLVVIFGISAVYAYKKVKDYQNL